MSPVQKDVAVPRSTCALQMQAIDKLFCECWSTCFLGFPADLLQPDARSDAAVQMQAMQQLLWASPPGGQQTLQWPAWKQGFFFCKHPGLQWGLVQRQGGPCGVLAAVQVLGAAFCSAHISCLAPSHLHCS